MANVKMTDKQLQAYLKKPKSIAEVAAKFGISKQAAALRLKSLADDGYVVAGTGLAPNNRSIQTFTITA